MSQIYFCSQDWCCKHTSSNDVSYHSLPPPPHNTHTYTHLKKHFSVEASWFNLCGTSLHDTHCFFSSAWWRYNKNSSSRRKNHAVSTKGWAVLHFSHMTIAVREPRNCVMTEVTCTHFTHFKNKCNSEGCFKYVLCDSHEVFSPSYYWKMWGIFPFIKLNYNFCVYASKLQDQFTL